MKAKRKPLDVISLDDLTSSNANDLSIKQWAAPAVRSKGIMVDDVSALVGELKNRGLL